MAGSSSDHTEAAIITPAAKPKNTFCVVWDRSFLKKNTMAEPRMVAKQVKPVPMAAYINSLWSISQPPFFYIRIS